VSLDLTALLAAQRAIKVARADYDFTRDGGATGQPDIQSELVPADSLVIGVAMWTSVALTFAGGGVLTFYVGPVTIGAPIAGLNQMAAGWELAIAIPPMPADIPIRAAITVGTVTAGAVTVWVFYLPLTD